MEENPAHLLRGLRSYKRRLCSGLNEFRVTHYILANWSYSHVMRLKSAHATAITILASELRTRLGKVTVGNILVRYYSVDAVHTFNMLTTEVTCSSVSYINLEKVIRQSACIRDLGRNRGHCIRSHCIRGHSIAIAPYESEDAEISSQRARDRKSEGTAS